jgi:mRNA-degrading endonuclease toxin of MazEF toxin-antitoxin module
VFPRQGEIYAARLPGRATYKQRPVVIVSPDYRNEYANDVLVIPLTTHLRPLPTHVLLEPGRHGLRQASVAKAEQITALPKDLLGSRPLGVRVSPGVLRELQKAVWRAVGGD